MDDVDTTPVEIKSSLVSQLDERSTAKGFDSVDEYIEYILKLVVNEMDSIDLGESKPDEDELRSRLKSLGYLDN